MLLLSYNSETWAIGGDRPGIVSKAPPLTDLPEGEGSVFYEIQSIKAMRIESARSSYKLIQDMKFCNKKERSIAVCQDWGEFVRIQVGANTLSPVGNLPALTRHIDDLNVGYKSSPPARDL